MNVHLTIIFVISVVSFAWQAETGLPLLHRGNDRGKETIVLPSPSQRQVVQRQACVPDSTELQRRIAVLECDADFIAALLDAGLDRCGFLIEDAIQLCGSDQNGTLCALHSPSFGPNRDIDDVARDIEEQCFRPLSDTFENCSNQCQILLEEYSYRFGCCIHAEPRVTSDDMAKILTPLLWSQCGVTRPDPCDNTPIIPDRSQTSDQSCSFLCLLVRYSALECKHLASKKIEIYEECSDTVSAREIRQECGFNEKGDYCGTIGGTELEDAFLVYQKCYGFFTSNECQTGCRAELEALKERLGCCVNNMNSTRYSSTDDVPVLVTGYELWSACGVETPGFCNLPTDTSLYDDYMIALCNTCDDI